MSVVYQGDQAKKYAGFANSSFSWKHVEKPALEKHLSGLLNSTTRVLDVGCGTGRSTQVLLERGASASNVTGSDVSPDMLEIARHDLPEVTFIESDLAELNFPPQSFDVIMSCMVLHYVNTESLKSLMKHFATWLSEGGEIVLLLTHPLRYVEHHAHYFEDTAREEPTPWGTTVGCHEKTISAYATALLEAGFELIALEEPRAETGKDENPEEFAKYSNIPSRLLLRARKK